MNINVLKTFYDDYCQDILHRYDILRLIQQEEPVGRRSISETLHLNERFVRKECDFLQRKKYITVGSIGMRMTVQGILILEDLRSFINEIRGNEKLERTLCQYLNIRRVRIVSNQYKKENENEVLGEASGNYLLQLLDGIKILGITGGSTMNELVNHIMPQKTYEELTIIPARGGLGGNPLMESNLIAYRLKEKLKSKYSGIYLPDTFDVQEVSTHYSDQLPVLDLIQQIDVLVFGVGNALEMAQKRRLSDEKIRFLRENKAVGEAFGHYFDQEGRMVYESKSLGVDIDTYRKVPRCIAVAGSGKEDAILSIASLNRNLDLVITENCANELYKKMKILKKFKEE